MSLSAAELAALEALEAESRATAIIAVTMSFLGLATVFVGLRVFVRGHLQKIFALDDWFMVLSYVCRTISYFSRSILTVADFIYYHGDLRCVRGL